MFRPFIFKIFLFIICHRYLMFVVRKLCLHKQKSILAPNAKQARERRLLIRTKKNKKKNENNQPGIENNQSGIDLPHGEWMPRSSAYGNLGIHNGHNNQPIQHGSLIKQEQTNPRSILGNNPLLHNQSPSNEPTIGEPTTLNGEPNIWNVEPNIWNVEPTTLNGEPNKLNTNSRDKRNNTTRKLHTIPNEHSSQSGIYQIHKGWWNTNQGPIVGPSKPPRPIVGPSKPPRPDYTPNYYTAPNGRQGGLLA
jgi:hypothetical protein